MLYWCVHWHHLLLLCMNLLRCVALAYVVVFEVYVLLWQSGLVRHDLVPCRIRVVLVIHRLDVHGGGLHASRHETAIVYNRLLLLLDRLALARRENLLDLFVVVILDNSLFDEFVFAPACACVLVLT